jgi:SAM-dependent methyltransferase
VPSAGPPKRAQRPDRSQPEAEDEALLDPTSTKCRICAGDTRAAGTRHGALAGRDFQIRQCPSCWFSFVADPWLDYGAIYDEDYYRGRGADPLTDYVDEAANPHRTVRRFEWRGILKQVHGLGIVGASTTWLDYGCGAGGLVQFLHQYGLPSAVGFEQSWSLDRLHERGVSVLSEEELAERAGTFDVVSAIEVIEHVVDPLAELARMRALLKPGGLLFLTTGNAKPYRGDVANWRYLIPEIHVSVFEPETLALALETAGFEPSFPGYGPGWVDIIRFKMLKNARRRYSYPFDELVPWPLVARLADKRWGFSAHPVGRVPAAPAEPVTATAAVAAAEEASPAEPAPGE